MRTQKTSGTKGALLNVRLPSTMKAAIKARALARDVSISDVIREAVLSVADACPTCGRPYHHRASSASVETAAE